MRLRSNNRYGWYVAFVLLIGFTFSFIDRQVLNLLVVPIQNDLNITDTQISALQGLAFVLTYVGLCIPIGRLIDKSHRVTVMIIGLLIWSIATIACGFSKNYVSMFIARMGIGAGESTVHPGSISILGDYFDSNKIASPMSIYLLGPYLGAGIAMIFGAQVLDWTSQMDNVIIFPMIGEIAPWQLTFIAVGLPGILIAGLFLTIREPQRKIQESESIEVPSFSKVIQYIKNNWEVYGAIIIGNSCLIILLYGLQSWVPTMLLRVYEWDLVQSGRVYGSIAMLAGSAGVLSGPFVLKYMSKININAPHFKLAIFGISMASLSLVLLPFQSNVNIALVCVTMASFFVTLPLAGTSSAMVIVSPNRIRGVITGIYVVVTSVFGLVLGPFLVASSTDFIFQDINAVAKSLALVSVLVGPVGIFFMFKGINSFREIKNV
jgi:MFS family permease